MCFSFQNEYETCFWGKGLSVFICLQLTAGLYSNEQWNATELIWAWDEMTRNFQLRNTHFQSPVLQYKELAHISKRVLHVRHSSFSECACVLTLSSSSSSSHVHNNGVLFLKLMGDLHVANS